MGARRKPSVTRMSPEAWKNRRRQVSDTSVTSRPRRQAIPNRKPSVFSFAEVLGLSADRADERYRIGDDAPGVARRTQANVDFGVSPHAPYSTPSNLVERCVDLAAKSAACRSRCIWPKRPRSDCCSRPVAARSLIRFKVRGCLARGTLSLPRDAANPGDHPTARRRSRGCC